MNITIIGAGWLGMPLAGRLVQRGHQVVATTTTEAKLPQLRASGVKPRLLNLDDAAPFPKFKTDLLILTPPPGRGAENIVARHRRRHERLLRESVGDERPRIVYLSSTGVYPNLDDWVDETTPPDPVRLSGAAMLAGERIWQRSGLPFTILRLAGLVGGDRQAGRWFTGKTGMPGGQSPVNMVHREDCLRALELMVDHAELTGTYNLCADEHPVRAAFYGEQAERYGFVAPTFSEGNDSIQPYKLVGNEKFKREASFRYAHPDPRWF